jgi:hypothetical protein
MNPLFLIIAASVVELCASISTKISAPTTGNIDFAIACGSVSLFMSLVLLALQISAPEICAKVLIQTGESIKCGARSPPTLTIEFCFVIFFLLWWCISGGLLTFQGPYTVASNGYFACWGGVGASILLLANSMPEESGTELPSIEEGGGAQGDAPPNLVQEADAAADAEKRESLREARMPVICVLVCGIVVLFAAVQSPAGIPAAACSFDPALCALSWRNIFAIVIASLSMVYSVIIVFCGHAIPKIALLILSVLAFVLWVVMAGICTFMLPFVETGNGFLGCWLGAVAMTYAMMPHVPWYIKGKDRADTKAMAASMKIVEEKAAFKTQEGTVPESAVAAESSLPGAPQY